MSKTFSQYSVPEFLEDIVPCAQQEVGVTVRRCLDILKVIGVVVWLVRGHELGSLSSEHIEKVVILGGTILVIRSSSSARGRLAWGEVVGAGSFWATHRCVMPLGGFTGL